MPKIYNLKEHKDQIPTDAVYVGRVSKWSCPFKVGRDGTHTEVVEKFRDYIEDKLAEDSNWCEELRGKHLVCSSRNDMSCVNILLEYANFEEEGIFATGHLVGYPLNREGT